MRNSSIDFFDQSEPKARFRDFCDRCERCGGKRFGMVDRETGRANAAAPSSCPDKDRCRAEVMAAAGHLDWKPEEFPPNSHKPSGPQ